MNKYHVTGRIRADIPVDEIVEASTEDSAINKAAKIIYKRCNINAHDHLDDEFYCDKILK